MWDLFSFLAEVDGFLDWVVAVAVGLDLRPDVYVLFHH